jgi:hypothetical protein
MGKKRTAGEEAAHDKQLIKQAVEKTVREFEE